MFRGVAMIAAAFVSALLASVNLEGIDLRPC
jgi:hypothetical protein